MLVLEFITQHVKLSPSTGSRQRHLPAPQINLNFRIPKTSSLFTHVNESKQGIKWSMIYCATLDFPDKRFFHQTCAASPFELTVGRWVKTKETMMAWCCSLGDLDKVFPRFTWWLIDKSSDDTWSSIMAREMWWKLMSGILKSRNAQTFSLALASLAPLCSVRLLFGREKWIIWRGEINNEMALLLGAGVLINNARN